MGDFQSVVEKRIYAIKSDTSVNKATRHVSVIVLTTLNIQGSFKSEPR